MLILKMIKNIEKNYYIMEIINEKEYLNEKNARKLRKRKNLINN